MISLDSCILIEILKGNEACQNRLAQYRPADCFVSTHVVYELLTGIEKMRLQRYPIASLNKKINSLEKLLGFMTIVPFERADAQEAAKVRAELEAEGKGIGPIDTLIAASARNYDHTLITDNSREFSRVKNLKIENWDL